MSERAKFAKGDVEAVKHPQFGVGEAGRLPVPPTLEGVDFGIFLDFSSIYQKEPSLFDARETPDGQPAEQREAFEEDLAAGRRPFGGQAYEDSRSPEHKASFGRALKSMDLLYAHQLTVVWRMTRLIDGYDARPYGDRGWVCLREEPNPGLSRAHSSASVRISAAHSPSLRRPRRSETLARLRTAVAGSLARSALRLARACVRAGTSSRRSRASTWAARRR